MTSPVQLFDDLAAQAQARPGITRNRRGSLVVDHGGVRAMTSNGSIVVKLDPARTHELVQAGAGRPYKGQVNAWLELDPNLSPARCRQLVEESLEG